MLLTGSLNATGPAIRAACVLGATKSVRVASFSRQRLFWSFHTDPSIRNRDKTCYHRSCTLSSADSTHPVVKMGNCNGLPYGDTQPRPDAGRDDGARPSSHAQTSNGLNVRPSSPSPPPRPDTDAPIFHRPLAGTGRVLGRPMEDVRKTYIFGRELGRGQFGVTYLVTHRETKEQFACKSIATRKLLNRDDIEDVRREVQIMHHLTGHRNIVELKGAYEDRHSVNLVMELCAGGELFDRIIAKGHYSERAAAVLCRQIVTVVHDCHTMGVMHRDLKPENFLFLSIAEDSPLKATDFGLSVFFKPGL